MAHQPPLSPWLEATEPSPTMRVKAQADALKRTRKLYDFGVGEICSRAIPLPAEYRAELFQAVERGETQYSLGKGDEVVIQ